MRFNVRRHAIQIEPENEQDVAYLEEVLCLRGKGDKAVAARRAPLGLDGVLACVEVRAAEPEGTSMSFPDPTPPITILVREQVERVVRAVVECLKTEFNVEVPKDGDKRLVDYATDAVIKSMRRP